MVKVVFYNLLRSKYNIKEMFVSSGTIHQIIEEILSRKTDMKQSDFQSSVVFHKGKPHHFHGFDKVIHDNDEIIITHFVGGG